MTVTFFSSVLNHHQISLCDALRTLPGVEFTFVQAIDLTEERRAQGFSAIEADFVVNAQKELDRAKKLCMESDVVIAGVIDQRWVNKRVAAGKLTFAYKERFCKDKKALFHPGFWENGFLNYFRFRDKNLYLLCASAYTAGDTKLIFPRSHKKFKWGYFPRVNIHANTQEHLAAKEPATILWAGRFLDWKHPETCIALTKWLKCAGYSFHLNVIGLGPLQQQLEALVAENDLEDCVILLGQKSPEEVRKQMGASEIFLITSDQKEGWGAVLNEAMSEGCACVASRQAGSTGFLIRDGENGYAFDYDDMDTLTRRVMELLDDRALLRRVQTAAMDTIAGEWNAETAAQRLMEFCTAAQSGEKELEYLSGPMSRA